MDQTLGQHLRIELLEHVLVLNILKHHHLQKRSKDQYRQNRDIRFNRAKIAVKVPSKFCTNAPLDSECLQVLPPLGFWSWNIRQRQGFNNTLTVCASRQRNRNTHLFLSRESQYLASSSGDLLEDWTIFVTALLLMKRPQAWTDKWHVWILSTSNCYTKS